MSDNEDDKKEEYQFTPFWKIPLMGDATFSDNDDDYEDIAYTHYPNTDYVRIDRYAGFNTVYYENIYQDGHAEISFDYDGESETTNENAVPSMSYEEALRRYHEQEQQRKDKK